MPTGQVRRMSSSRGYSQVTKLEADDGRVEREGIKNGQKMELIVYRLGQRGLSFGVEPRSSTPPTTCRNQTWKAPGATSPAMSRLRGAWRGVGSRCGRKQIANLPSWPARLRSGGCHSLLCPLTTFCSGVNLTRRTRRRIPQRKIGFDNVGTAVSIIHASPDRIPRRRYLLRHGNYRTGPNAHGFRLSGKKSFLFTHLNPSCLVITATSIGPPTVSAPKLNRMKPIVVCTIKVANSIAS